MHSFPPKLQVYFESMSVALQVQPEALAALALTIAGAAIGTTHQLNINDDFTVFGTLWTVIVGESGANKSAIFKEILAPMKVPLSITDIDNDLLSTQSAQGQYVLGDTTTAAMLDVIRDCPRGLLLAVPEIAGWFASFDRFSHSSEHYPS